MKREVCRVARMMTGIAIFGAASTLCSAASVTTFYDYSVFEDALSPGTQSTTESFAGNQINTPGLTITVCGGTGLRTFCAPAGSGDFSDDRSSFSNNQFSDVPGRLNGVGYSQIFTLPNDTTAVGFFINEDPNPFGSRITASFNVELGNTALYPFGGVGGPNDPFPGLPNPSFPYTGFLGFVSDTPFDTLEFNSTFGDPASYTIDDLTFATPEPATIGLAGLAILGLAVTKRQWSGKKR